MRLKTRQINVKHIYGTVAQVTYIAVLYVDVNYESTNAAYHFLDRKSHNRLMQSDAFLKIYLVFRMNIEYQLSFFLYFFTSSSHLFDSRLLVQIKWDFFVKWIFLSLKKAWQSAWEFFFFYQTFTNPFVCVLINSAMKSLHLYYKCVECACFKCSKTLRSEMK